MLALRPTTAEIAYTIRSEWAEFVVGDRRLTSLEKTVGLHLTQAETKWQLRLRTSASVLHKADRTSFDEIGLRLADLYADLELALAPTGKLVGLVNHAAIRARWAGLRQELASRYPEPSALVDALVAGVDRQLAHPAGLESSLAYDYLYAALPGSFYAQLFADNCQYTRARTFPQFFDGLALHFIETLRLADAGPSGQVVLRLRGTLDAAATDVAAVAEYLRATLGQSAAIAPADVLFSYEATHSFAPGTGLPAEVHLTVRCAYRELYCKEYHLTFTPILPTI
ncbi:hypothetical protein [Hymenobacter terrenus]|uniref:hypothetical protein n=1 Tax=Hymenobacter terrenus TaxID=1629124 RepID=UPI0006193B86|nr:hypothetical protein [Hymenobacter terrenus]